MTLSPGAVFLPWAKVGKKYIREVSVTHTWEVYNIFDNNNNNNRGLGSFTILHGGMEVGILFSDQVLKVEALEGLGSEQWNFRAPKGCLGDLLGIILRRFPS